MRVFTRRAYHLGAECAARRVVLRRQLQLGGEIMIDAASVLVPAVPGARVPAPASLSRASGSMVTAEFDLARVPMVASLALQ